MRPQGRTVSIILTRLAAALPWLLTAALPARAGEAMRSEVRLAFFPPDPPVYGGAIADPVKPGRRERPRVAPEDLGYFVNESFYPALATRMAQGGLHPKIEAELDAYRVARAELVNELADQLTALRDADPRRRESELRAFAAQQTARIVVLEDRAERLRKEIIAGNLLQRSADWNRTRKWTLGVTKFPQDFHAREAEFQVLRAAAYYQDGLTPQQRGLVREQAIELESRARAALPVPPPRTHDVTAMFFSPETARLRLLPKLPPELLAKIARFNQQKAALKQELRDAVSALDRELPHVRRERFEALARDQAPRLELLNELAEEIRRGFAALPPPPPPPAPPWIPAELLVEIRAYEHDRGVYLQEYEDRLRFAASLVTLPPLERNASADAQLQRARLFATRRAAAMRDAAQAFEHSTRERFQILRERYDAIRTAMATVAGSQSDPETGRPLNADTLLRAHASAMEKFETLGREEIIYQGYRTAMLLPGLSPEQRRLLFGAALVGLAQPLPAGEPMPSGALPVPRR
jgi:hypothetical protein